MVLPLEPEKSHCLQVTMDRHLFGPANFREGCQALAQITRLELQKANKIDDNVIALIFLHILAVVFLLLKILRGSCLWLIDSYVKLLKSYGILSIDFQHCKWAMTPSRAKWTKLVTNIPTLDSISG